MYGTAQMQHYTRIRVRVLLHTWVGTLSDYMWLSAHVYQIPYTHVLNIVHAYKCLSTHKIWYMCATCEQVQMRVTNMTQA